MRFIEIFLLEISCLQGSHSLTSGYPSDLWPPPKRHGSFTSYVLPSWQECDSSMFIVLKYCAYKIFTVWRMMTPCLRDSFKIYTVWPLVSPSDLWSTPKAIGINFLIWYTHTPSMKVLKSTLLEMLLTRFSKFEF